MSTKPTLQIVKRANPTKYLHRPEGDEGIEICQVTIDARKSEVRSAAEKPVRVAKRNI